MRYNHPSGGSVLTPLLCPFTIYLIMPTNRKVVFANGEIYHVLNRTVGPQDIFIGKRELSRALSLIDYYRFVQKTRFSVFKKLSHEAQKLYLSRVRSQVPLVEIHAYALMSDHFHLLVRQLRNNGVVRFISNFQNALAKYINRR